MVPLCRLVWSAPKTPGLPSVPPLKLILHYSLGPRGVYLALASIQCFIVVSKAPESPDSKSARCKDVTFGEIELFTFEKKKLKKD